MNKEKQLQEFIDEIHFKGEIKEFLKVLREAEETCTKILKYIPRFTITKSSGGPTQEEQLDDDAEVMKVIPARIEVTHETYRKYGPNLLKKVAGVANAEIVIKDC